MTTMQETAAMDRQELLKQAFDIMMRLSDEQLKAVLEEIGREESTDLV